MYFDNLILWSKSKDYMTIKISLADFFKYTKIDYEEDLFNFIYHDYQEHNISTILDNMPKKYDWISAELLEDISPLYDVCNRAVNRAEESGLEAEAYKQQRKAVEEFASHMADYINQVADNEAVKSISIDWNNDQAIVECDEVQALSTIREIINGEGYFYYEDDKALAEAYDGTNDPKQAVTGHVHYLLNVKLIDDIYGMTGIPRFNWEVNSWDIDQDYISEMLDEELPTLPEDIRQAISKLQNGLTLLEHKFN
jgi:hypothetical protein